MDELPYVELFNNLINWKHEGAGSMKLIRPGVMHLECLESKQGGAGCQAFCNLDFPDHIRISFDIISYEKNGLVIIFLAMKGVNGEDMFEMPKREGVFGDYVAEDCGLQSYHVSLSRYDDDGVHTGVSNWRRNPGLNLMAQGDDLCKEIKKTYTVTIEKRGGNCRLLVDGKFAHGFNDPHKIEGSIPDSGKIGFRLIGRKVIADISNFRVEKL